MSYSIAIDGPAGAGKSTIAKEISRRMGCHYVDTGAMYRAMALFIVKSGIPTDDSRAISEKCKEADIVVTYEDGAQIVWLNGENVNGQIRTQQVGDMASVTSVNPDVRKKLVELQQKLASTTDIIMDGRDIGTCVLPNATVKIYLTASVEVRAKRRYDELIGKGQQADLLQVAEEIRIRDERDMNRDISPLRQAEDAILVDTSDMGVEEVIETIMKIAKEKGCGQA